MTATGIAVVVAAIAAMVIASAVATTSISQTINFVDHIQIKFDPSFDPIHIIRY